MRFKSSTLDHGLAEACATSVRTLFVNALEIAKTFPRLARRFFRAHAGGDVLRRALLDVEAQLVVNLLLCHPSCSERPKF